MESMSWLGFFLFFGGPPLGLVIYWEDSQDSAIVILMAVIYYRERIQSKVSKGTRCMGRNRKPGVSFQESFPSGLTQNALNSSSNKL